MQLIELYEAVEILRTKGWKVQPPAHKSRTRIISEAMSSPNQKRSLAAKRMWKARRKKAA
jgi:hypothetical protein